MEDSRYIKSKPNHTSSFKAIVQFSSCPLTFDWWKQGTWPSPSSAEQGNTLCLLLMGGTGNPYCRGIRFSQGGNERWWKESNLQRTSLWDHSGSYAGWMEGGGVRVEAEGAGPGEREQSLEFRNSTRRREKWADLEYILEVYFTGVDDGLDRSNYCSVAHFIPDIAFMLFLKHSRQAVIPGSLQLLFLIFGTLLSKTLAWHTSSINSSPAQMSAPG